jgi:hypothetical protein
MRLRRRRIVPSTPMLAHFTRAESKASAMDNLVRILESCAISGSSRLVPGKQRAVCMFDVPIPDLYRVLVKSSRRRYEPFGVAVDKRYAFAQGARPVIYLPLAEAAEIVRPEELWRVVSLDFARTPPIDWSFEREWRMRGDLPLQPKLTVALVNTWADAEEIYDRFGGDPPCAGVIPLREMAEAV